MSFRTVYVSRGATVDQVRAAVDTYLSSLGRVIETRVEFADDYPGFDTAVDVYGPDDATVFADARTFVAGVAPLLPGRRLVIDLDIKDPAPAPSACTGLDEPDHAVHRAQTGSALSRSSKPVLRQRVQ